MKKKKHLWNAAILLFCSGFFPGCEIENIAMEQSLRIQMQELEKEIDDMIGDAACSGSEDCRFIGFGAKPCGGPWRYLVYSIAVTDSVELAEKVAAYNGLEKRLNELLGRGSDCGIPTPPTVSCVQGRCVAVTQSR